MSMRYSRVRLGLAMAGLVVLVAACDSDNDGGTAGATGIDSLGDDFGRAFAADPNSDPVDAQDVSLTLTPTIEPFDPT